MALIQFSSKRLIIQRYGIRFPLGIVIMGFVVHHLTLFFPLKHISL